MLNILNKLHMLNDENDFDEIKAIIENESDSNKYMRELSGVISGFEQSDELISDEYRYKFRPDNIAQSDASIFRMNL